LIKISHGGENMTTEQDAITPVTPPAQSASKSWNLSLDWWAVISALILAVIVFFGLQVAW
jgi:hypothetical protein